MDCYRTLYDNSLIEMQETILVNDNKKGATTLSIDGGEFTLLSDFSKTDLFQAEQITIRKGLRFKSSTRIQRIVRVYSEKIYYV